MKIKHEGLHVHRLKPEAGNPLEVCFAEEWARRNQGDGRNSVESTLAYMLGEGDGPVEISHRDARIAATVIQWLGTNVGRSFVDEVHQKYRQQVDATAKDDMRGGYRVLSDVRVGQIWRDNDKRHVGQYARHLQVLRVSTDADGVCISNYFCRPAMAVKH